MIAGMGWFGTFEWFRESLRKPYIITGYMYGNSQEVALTEAYKTKGLLEAAQVIAGAKLFVGNQTATHAIAEGLKKPIVLEVWREGPNCIVHRPGVVHGWDRNVVLPEL